MSPFTREIQPIISTMANGKWSFTFVPGRASSSFGPFEFETILAFGTTADGTAHRDDILAAQLLGRGERRGAVGVANHLHEALAALCRRAMSYPG